MSQKPQHPPFQSPTTEVTGSKRSKVPSLLKPIPSSTLVFDDEGRVLAQKSGKSLNVIRRSKSDHSNIPLRSQKEAKSVAQNIPRKHWTLPSSTSRRESQYIRNAPETFDQGDSFKPNVFGEKECERPIKSDTTLPKIKRPVIPQSETRRSYKTSISERKTKPPLPPLTYRGKQATKVSSEVGISSCWTSNQVPCSTQGNQFIRSINSQITPSRTLVKQTENISNYESNKMRTARSEISLLEQKRSQWAKEREELNGLWSPWGRQSENIMSSRHHSPSLQMQASYPSPTNVVSSSYVSNLGIGSTYSSSHSECYLPPINSTIAQQPRQKAKVWNAEFQTEDYRYESDSVSSSSHNPPPHRPTPTPNNSHRTSRGQLSSRKASLPNYMYETAEGYNCGNNSHQQMLIQQHNTLNNNGGNRNEMWSSNSMDDEAFTSGYYSNENNNNNDEDYHRISGNSKEIILKPTSRERSYQEEVTVQKAIAIKNKGKRDGDGTQSPRVIVHKIFAQNGEVLVEHDGSQEYIVNSVTVSSNGGDPNRPNADHYGMGGGGGNYNRRQSENSRSPMGNLPRNHAMRSSLTIGVDASNVDAYYENDRRKKEQWLSELEKQREEQRLRKLMEKEERRPRWGDRGIGVGHFWEPSESENSHLPPYTSRGKSTARSESIGNGIDSTGVQNSGTETYQHSAYHPGQSNTPPAWLERSLTRMQSSKSQPSLRDPDYTNDFDYMEGTAGKGAQMDERSNSYNSSRSLNQSSIDLRNVAGYCSPTGDSSDRTFLRGHNVPIDPDTVSEREKRRLVNQEHLEALKKQIEERQQQQKEEKERRLQEEREQEMRMARQREVELQRLEMEKRGKMPVNGDMPNCVEETNDSSKIDVVTESGHVKSTKISTLAEHSSQPVRDPSEEKDIEIVQRQNVMMVAAPSEEDKTEESSSASNNPHHYHPRLSRQDQCVMTDSSDPMCERTLTPSIQRSRSLSMSRSSREFGTQTELSDGSSSSSGSGSSCASGKNGEKTRSHNSLLDKKQKDKNSKEQEKLSKKSEERPRWGSNPIKKQYIKQSEKDPNYISRMRRRQERLKKMEEDRSARVDTGTESEDVSIPFYRIRQRRNHSEAGKSPQRPRGKGLLPLKATVPIKPKTENDDDGRGEVEKHHHHPEISTRSNKNGKTCRISPPLPPTNLSREGGTSGRDISQPFTDMSHSHTMKNSQSETNLNKSQQSRKISSSDIIDRNFGSVPGIPVIGTSEESSGFSTPFLPRRDLGSGSTESGTTGSGSGVQSPDMAYHAYQADKSTREERKYNKITSGRDTHRMTRATSENNVSKTAPRKELGTIGQTKSKKEFDSPLKGFIHQHDFDEMPVKSMKSSSMFNIPDTVAENDQDQDKAFHKILKDNQSSSDDILAPTPREMKTSPKGRSPRNKSLSPRRKPSPMKVPKSSLNKSKGKSVDGPRTATLSKNNNLEESMEGNDLPDGTLSQPKRLASPPVPALLKKMQMGLKPDESGRISSLPTEFPDILAPLPPIPISLLSPNPSRLSSASASATSGESSSVPGKIDIDIAVTRRNSPGVMKLLEAADERLKQRQLTAIMNDSNNNGSESIFDGNPLSSRTRPSFEADIGSISINLEPLMHYNTDHSSFDNGEARRLGSAEFEIPLSSARLSIKSHSISSRSPTNTKSTEAAKHEAFITSILNSKEVKEQLSARESELSEKGIIEFSIKLPSTSSGDEFMEEYRDPLLTERRRHTAQWLYGTQNGGVSQKQAILTNLSTLKKGISLQQQDWKIGNSDTE